MERLTERFDNGQAAVMGCGKNCKYDYKYCRNHYEECPEINKIYERLAEYEDTGLTPEQVMELKERDTEKAPEIHENKRSSVYTCPSCNLVLINKDEKGWFCGQHYKFCPDCGQRLKWEE